MSDPDDDVPSLEERYAIAQFAVDTVVLVSAIVAVLSILLVGFLVYIAIGRFLL